MLISFLKGKMKKRVYIFCIFIAITFSSNAQEITDTAFEKTVFWKVTGNGLKDTSYLYGTAHPIFREDIHITDTVLHTLLRSSTAYFENIPSVNDDSIYITLNIMNKPKLYRILGN